MTPRPDSRIGKALEYIRARGSARSREIAQHLGCSTSTVSALLSPYVTDGTLVACKVDIPFERQQNEYRISATVDGKVAVQTVAQRNAQHSASLSSGSSLVRAPVPGVGRDAPPKPTAPRHEELQPPYGWLRSRNDPGAATQRPRTPKFVISDEPPHFSSALHGDGRLVLELDGDTMVLAPAFTEEVARLLSGRAYQAKEIAA